MPSCLPIECSPVAPRAVAPRHRVPLAIASCGALTDPSATVDWPLRFAQRAFADLIETALPDSANQHAERIAQLRDVARRTWSRLSADSRAQLTRWLGVQLATRSHDAGGAALARIDATLADATFAPPVATTLAHARRELGLPQPNPMATE